MVKTKKFFVLFFILWILSSYINLFACSLSDIDSCKTKNECITVGGFWYNNKCNIIKACSDINLPECNTKDKCEGSNYYWYDNKCNLYPKCRPGFLNKCETKDECLSIGLYWYNNKCNEHPLCYSPENCKTQDTCEGSHYYWYNNVCHSEPQSTDPSCIPVTGKTAYFNQETGFCEIDPDLDGTCPDNYSFLQSIYKCVSQPVCPSGYTYDMNKKRCINYTQVHNNLEEENFDNLWSAQCPEGSYNSNTNRCEVPAQRQVVCPAGFVYNSGINKCVKTYTGTCSSSTVVAGDSDVCIEGSVYSHGCDVKTCLRLKNGKLQIYTKYRGSGSWVPVTGSGSSYIRYGGDFYGFILSDFKIKAYPYPMVAFPFISLTGSGRTGSSTFTIIVDHGKLALEQTCRSCTGDNGCESESFSSPWLDLGLKTIYSCSIDNKDYNSLTTCQQNCKGTTYTNPQYNYLCPSDFTLDSSALVCYASPGVCYPDNISQEQASNYIIVKQVKPVPGSNRISGLLYNMYSYPEIKTIQLPPGSRLPTSSEVAVLQTIWPDVSFWIKNEIPDPCRDQENSIYCSLYKKNIIVVWDNPNTAGFFANCVISDEGRYLCLGDMIECKNNICPYGNYPCLSYQGEKYCSKTSCSEINFNEIQNAQNEDTPEPFGLGNDNDITKNGCTGQIYIFNGSAFRCRTAGMQTGFHNCCDENSGTIKDPVGPNRGPSIASLFNTGKILWNSFQAAKLYNALSAPETGITSVGNTVKVTQGGQVIMTAKANSVMGQALKSAALNPGSDIAATATGNFLKNSGLASSVTGILATRLINDPVMSSVANFGAQALLYLAGFAGPFALASAGLQVAMSLAMSKCDSQDYLTCMYKNSGYCHYVGTWCIKKLPAIGCVQKAKRYCCFKSKLARIIQEQGRKQLKTLNSWGSAKHPLCRGFTPEEFQMIDFSKIDFSEWYDEIETRVQGDIRNKFQEKLQRFRQ